jgi:hypothetical protein
MQSLSLHGNQRFPCAHASPAQAQAHCRPACDYTRHCKRVRSHDDGHVLLLLGPAHLVPDSFWDAARLLLEASGGAGEASGGAGEASGGAGEASGGAGPQAELCVHVPVVTTVPITQVKRAAAPYALAIA